MKLIKNNQVTFAASDAHDKDGYFVLREVYDAYRKLKDKEEG